MTILHLVSWAIIVVNPLSAIMLSWLVIHHRKRMRIGVIARTFVVVYCVTLLMQASDQIDFLRDWRPPRATNWIYALAAQHGIIWALFFKTVFHPARGYGGTLGVK